MNRTVLITGASSGIGRATALLFQRHGWQVAASMRSPEKETELAALDKVFCPALDVCDPASVEGAVAATRERFGGLDVLVNNAGYGLLGPFECTTPDQVEKQFATNVYGVMHTTRAVLPHFRTQQSGVIVNLSSVSGRATVPLFSLYHATKWAVEGFSDSLQYELQPFNIRVKLIEPGPVATAFYGRSVDRARDEGTDAYDALIARSDAHTDESVQWMNGRPEDVAAAVYKAATDGSWRLRYPVAGYAKPFLFGRWLLPDALWRPLIRWMTLR